MLKKSVIYGKKVESKLLVTAYTQRKMSKEVPPSGNEESLQKLVVESKKIEWETLIENGAVVVHYWQEG